MKPAALTQTSGLLLLATLVALATPAQAHANLLEAHPGPSQQVPTAPDVLYIKFTEAVERHYTRGEVYDQNGTRRDAGRVIFDEQDSTKIYVPLTELEDGVYQVKWYSLSADTHTLSGTYLFAVGSASLEGLGGATSGHDHGSGWITMPVESTARGIFYIGLAAGFGVAVFHLLVARPIEGISGSRGTRLAFAISGVAAGIGAIAAFIVLLSFAQRIDADLTDAMRLGSGRLLAARIAGLLVTAAILLGLSHPRLGPTTRYGLIGVVLLGLGTMYATTMSSHAAALSESRTSARVADFAHLLGGATWAGGLLALVCAAPFHGASEVARLVRRFSPMAMASVALIVITGAFAGFLHLRSPADLVSGPYGLSLLVKILLMVPLLGLAAFNRYRITPRLAHGEPKSHLLTRSVAAEVFLVVVVLLAAGTLATHPPPGAATQTGGTADFLLLEKSLEGAHMQFRIQPNPPRVGIQNFTVSLHPYDQRQNPNGTQVFLKFAPEGQPEPETLVEAQRASVDDWILRGGYLTERGRWTIWVLVQFPNDFERTSFTVNVQ